MKLEGPEKEWWLGTELGLLRERRAGNDQGLASFCKDVRVDVAYLLRKACCITVEASEYTH